MFGHKIGIYSYLNEFMNIFVYTRGLFHHSLTFDQGISYFDYANSHLILFRASWH